MTIEELRAIASANGLCENFCQTCLGTGNLHGDTCPNCGGSGRLWRNATVCLDDKALQRLGLPTGA